MIFWEYHKLMMNPGCFLLNTRTYWGSRESWQYYCCAWLKQKPGSGLPMYHRVNESLEQIFVEDVSAAKFPSPTTRSLQTKFLRC